MPLALKVFKGIVSEYRPEPCVRLFVVAWNVKMILRIAVLFRLVGYDRYNLYRCVEMSVIRNGARL